MFGPYPDLTSYTVILELQLENAKLQYEVDRLKAENALLNAKLTPAYTLTPEAADHKKILQLEQRIASLEAAGHFPTHRPPTFEADYILETPNGRQYLYGRESAVMALKARINGLTEKLAAAKAALGGK